MDNRIDAVMPPHHRSFHWAGYCIGFALGGFFDGILLHQILQWHHLLSSVGGTRFSDLRIQVLADGLFHAAMYAIAIVGIWNLVRARHVFVLKNADRLLAANAMIGFGAWHIVDGIVSHWILGIHHVRSDAANPLFWDVLWFALFGILVLGCGFLVRRWRAPPPSGNDRRARTQSTIGLVLLLALAGGAGISAIPLAQADAAGTTVVVLRPGASPQMLLSALQAGDTRLVWSNASGNVWALALDRNVSRLSLYRHGALFVSGTLLPAGCAAWMRT